MFWYIYVLDDSVSFGDYGQKYGPEMLLNLVLYSWLGEERAVVALFGQHHFCVVKFVPSFLLVVYTGMLWGPVSTVSHRLCNALSLSCSCEHTSRPSLLQGWTTTTLIRYFNIFPGGGRWTWDGDHRGYTWYVLVSPHGGSISSHSSHGGDQR